MLDVGCGPGLFLIEARKRGWEVYGTEFTDKQLEYLESEGISMLKGKLTSDSFQNEMFDVIISSEVIEHINNPLEEMQHFNRLLRKGGLVYITTPNFNALERRILKGSYSIIEYPEHLSYYTPRTLNYLLKKSGFRKKRITTTGLSIARLKNSRKRKKEGRMVSDHNDDRLRASLEKAKFNWVKRMVNWFLNFFRLGNSLKAWYVKS